MARILKDAGITKERVDGDYQRVPGRSACHRPQAESRYRTLEKIQPRPDPYGPGGKLDPVIGRDDEILPRHSDSQPPDQEQPGC